MSNDDYIYTLYRNNEDSPYYYKQEMSYKQLVKELSEIMEDEDGVEFCEEKPDWEYSADHNYIYITRLPKKAPKPEIFIPNFKRAIQP